VDLEAPLTSPRFLRIALVASAATMCTRFKDDPIVDSAIGSGDRGAVEAGPSCDPSKGFGKPAIVSGLESGPGTSVSSLRLSRDYRTAYFQATGRPRSVGYSDLYTAKRVAPEAPFADITPLEGGGINTAAEEFDPSVSGSGLTLVFGRAQPGGDPVHLQLATRETTATPFTYIGPLVDVNGLDTTYDTTPFLRDDGQVLYFASDRVPENSTDIYRASSNGSTFHKPVEVSELNTSFSERSPVVSPDDLTIYFASDRTDGHALGQQDIWVATRASPSGPFSTPVNVSELNSPLLEVPNFVTHDGCALYFSSNRDGFLGVYVAERPRR
jgi:WD40-like Beta Propeller Repeat